jgi:vacuolar-type H+-ATPase subunit H
MTKSKAINKPAAGNTGLSFEKQLYGYNMSQVDNYIVNLRKAYQMAYDEYNDACVKFKELTDKSKTQAETKDLGDSGEFNEKVLNYTEMIAQKIIDDAKAEFVQIVADANTESQRIMNSAEAEAATVSDKANKLLDEANTKISKANESAKKIICDARKEADSILLTMAE